MSEEQPEVQVFFGKPRKRSGRKPIPPELQAKAKELVDAGLLTWEDIFGAENPGEDWEERAPDWYKQFKTNH